MEFDDWDRLEPFGFLGKDVFEGLGDSFEQVVFKVVVDGQLADFTLDMVQVVVVLRDVHHATTRYSGRRRSLQILNLKQHPKLLPELDSLTICQTQRQVIIQYSIKILNPQRIDGPIKRNPVMSFILTIVALPDD